MKIQTKYETDLVDLIIRRFHQLSGDRGIDEALWQQVAERLIPAHSGSFTIGSTPVRNTSKVFDSTAAIALGRFAAIMDSMLTPENQKWHKIASDNDYLNKNREVRKYFEEVNNILFRQRYASRANFSAQNQQDLISLGAYGNSAMYIDELYGSPGLRYKSNHIGEIYFGENFQGMIDEVFRYFPMTARQCVQKWAEKCPKKIADAVANNPEQKFFFIHVCMPRGDYDPERYDYKGMPFGAYYVFMEERELIAEGGYTTFPYAVARYVQTAGQKYGGSPAQDVLPAIKTLNEEKRTMLKQGQRALDPVLLAHDDGIMDGFSLRSGDVNYGAVSADGRPLVHVLPTGNFEVGKEMMDDERVVIKDAFLSTLFQILVEGPQKTATEVMELAKEKGILLAPTMGRQRTERLGPMIEREIDILSKQRGRTGPLIPPMPGLLREAQGEYKITYESPLSRAQRSEEAAGFMRTLEVTLQAVNITQDPSALDNFNLDVIIPEIADISGMPLHWMNGPDQIAALRQQRSLQQQQKQMMEAAPGAAAMLNAGAKLKAVQ